MSRGMIRILASQGEMNTIVPRMRGAELFPSEGLFGDQMTTFIHGLRRARNKKAKYSCLTLHQF